MYGILFKKSWDSEIEKKGIYGGMVMKKVPASNEKDRKFSWMISVKFLQEIQDKLEIDYNSDGISLEDIEDVLLYLSDEGYLEVE